MYTTHIITTFISNAKSRDMHTYVHYTKNDQQDVETGNSPIMDIRLVLLISTVTQPAVYWERCENKASKYTIRSASTVT